MTAERIENYLMEHMVWASVWLEGENVEVEISWGDWKHDHLRCAYLMDAIGYERISVEVTDEDGSDAYSAIHTYRRKK